MKLQTLIYELERLIGDMRYDRSGDNSSHIIALNKILDNLYRYGVEV